MVERVGAIQKADAEVQCTLVKNGGSMSTVRKLHDKAMKLAQLSLVARHEGKTEQAEELARQAYECESQAAELVPEDKSSEPTRSILYRSAASLAYQCRELSTAQRLIGKGLSGYPPPQIEQELKDLYEQVNFETHLKLIDTILQKDDFQLSLNGNIIHRPTPVAPDRACAPAGDGETDTRAAGEHDG